MHRSVRDKQWFERPQAFLGGLHSCSYDVRAKTGEGRCLGVTIKPNMAHLLVRDKLNHFENSVIDLESVFGNNGKRLSESVMNEDSIELKMQRIEDFFTSYADTTSSSDSSLLIEKSLSAPDDCRIAELSRNVGLSESHFRRLFRELVGINAKRFFKIRRVNRAIELIQKDSSSQLTHIAYALGFFDQAHFLFENFDRSQVGHPNSFWIAVHDRFVQFPSLRLADLRCNK